MTRTESAVITAQMIEELNPSLLKLALRKVARRADAEDLVQETWFSALCTASTFEGRSSLRAWVLGIMRRRIADHYRRERPTASLDEEEHASAFVAAERLHDWSEAAQFALAGLSELTPLERTAITLCDIQDVDRDEAAERMKIARGYLRVLLCRARAKLEATLRLQGVEGELCA